ncbi:MAG: transcriptional regulator [bacterium]|nr:transcriptional regulator [bacterium]
MNTPDPALRQLAGLDKVIHEPGRLAVVAYLNAVAEADFLFLQDQTGLTRGNLSSHMSKLEEAGYVAVEKMFVGKTPRTAYRLTDTGRTAFASYRQQLLQALGEGV